MRTTDLSNIDLKNALLALVTDERMKHSQVIAHLAEFDERQLYREEACGSMHSYCTERLNYSDDAAFKRIRVARLARRFPVVLWYLESGKVHLTGLSRLAMHLTEENHLDLLERASFSTTRQIDEICVSLAPRPDVPDSVRALNKPSSLPMAAQDQLVSKPVAKPARTTPLAPERFAVQFTADKPLKELIDRAKELLPGSDLADIIARALRLLVDDVEKQRFAKCAKPRKQSAAGKLRRIPNAIKRAVFERDEGRCTYKGKNGRRCTSRRVEFDHKTAFARGGEASVENLRLLCKSHNQLAAEETFGKQFMRTRRKARERQRSKAPRQAAAG